MILNTITFPILTQTRETGIEQLCRDALQQRQKEGFKIIAMDYFVDRPGNKKRCCLVGGVGGVVGKGCGLIGLYKLAGDKLNLTREEVGHLECGFINSGTKMDNPLYTTGQRLRKQFNVTD